MKKAQFIEINAPIRYWEDTRINHIVDNKGTVPKHKGNLWVPIINLNTGYVIDWPENMKASVNYKICDVGEYWLLNSQYERIAKWNKCYVKKVMDLVIILYSI